MHSFYQNKSHQSPCFGVKKTTKSFVGSHMIPAWGEGLPCEGPMQAGQGAVADFPALKNMMKSDQYYVMYYFIRKNISLYIFIYIYICIIYIYVHRYWTRYFLGSPIWWIFLNSYFFHSTPEGTMINDCFGTEPRGSGICWCSFPP